MNDVKNFAKIFHHQLDFLYVSAFPRLAYHEQILDAAVLFSKHERVQILQ